MPQPETDNHRPTLGELNTLLRDTRKSVESGRATEEQRKRFRADILEKKLEKLAESPAIEELARILREDELIVPCTKPFGNSGYPFGGRCQIAVSQYGLGVGFWRMSGEIHPNSRIFAERIEPGTPLNPRNYHRDVTFWIKSDFKWQPFSKWFGAREFDCVNLVEAGISYEEIENSILAAVEHLKSGTEVPRVPLRA